MVARVPQKKKGGVRWLNRRRLSGLTTRFNPWIGCSKVHTGCTHCYAEADMDKRRHRVKWGPQGTRNRTSDDYWKQPLKWDREAGIKASNLEIDVPPRVFCGSLCDVFEDWQGPIVNAQGDVILKPYLESERHLRDSCPIEQLGQDMQGWQPVTMTDLRRDLFELIDRTPNLQWLLLTKRPENILGMWAEPVGPLDEATWPGKPRLNVMLGCSVSDQETADRLIPDLLKCRDLCRGLFVSVEPLVGPVDLSALPGPGGWTIDSLNGVWTREYGPTFDEPGNIEDQDGPALDLVIIGGESGRQARPCNVAWVRSLVEQCRAAQVACFVKQLGAHIVDDRMMVEWPAARIEPLITPYRCAATAESYRIYLRDPKGGDMSEWPEDLRVREWPE